MKKIVGVSLGSSKRDHEVDVEMFGEKYNIKRLGTDGDVNKAINIIESLDGNVDAIGLGGIDAYLWLGEKRYPIKDAKKLMKAAKITPIVDGSGLKNTLEKRAIFLFDMELAKKQNKKLVGKKVLMVSAVDRYGMAEAFYSSGCKILYGDLIFGLNIPLPIRSYKNFVRIARLVLPIVTNLPFEILYPTGEKQDKEPSEKYTKYYEEADIIAGDFHLIKKYMPKDMTGKWVITNTTTASDVEDMKNRNVNILVTTTPNLEGRSFGTNVMDAAFFAHIKSKNPHITWDQVLSSHMYFDLLNEINYFPRIEELNRLMIKIDFD
ncbi:quinate 5-dehydrogenase [bacterium CG2_30_37_16]|nr:MAG: quinate 5-dehydrogenase [bacterium CG2_30_37_16]